MSCRRVNVEDVWKTDKGEFFGMRSGKKYEKSEVEEIHNGCYWTKPNHAADNWEADSMEDAVEAEK